VLLTLLGVVVLLGAVAAAVIVLGDNEDEGARATHPAAKGAQEGNQPADPPVSSAGQVPTAGSGPEEVTCWDGARAASQQDCTTPTGQRGLATVFPSLTAECVAVEPKIAEKVEVFECQHRDYLLRFTRWEPSYDWLAYYDAENGVPGTEWDVEDVVAGRQWLSFENSPDETDPWQWSAAYDDFPFSVSIESPDEAGRRAGILEVQVVPASRVGLR
jgi:hypothetical protein